MANCRFAMDNKNVTTQSNWSYRTWLVKDDSARSCVKTRLAVCVLLSNGFKIYSYKLANFKAGPKMFYSTRVEMNELKT